MAKKGKFIVYKKASEKFKRGAGTDPEVITPKSGWSQAEVEFLSTHLPPADGRVSYPHEGTGEKVPPSKSKVKAEK